MPALTTLMAEPASSRTPRFGSSHRSAWWVSMRCQGAPAPYTGQWLPTHHPVLALGEELPTLLLPARPAALGWAGTPCPPMRHQGAPALPGIRWQPCLLAAPCTATPAQKRGAQRCPGRAVRPATSLPPRHLSPSHRRTILAPALHTPPPRTLPPTARAAPLHSLHCLRRGGCQPVSAPTACPTTPRSTARPPRLSPVACPAPAVAALWLSPTPCRISPSFPCQVRDAVTSIPLQLPAVPCPLLITVPRIYVLMYSCPAVNLQHS